MAGIDIETGSCIRPMPYIRFENCEKLKIIPGSIIEGKFKKSPNPTGPHTEDHNYEGLTLVDACNKGMFYKILNDSCVPDVSTGFKIALEHKQKHIPIGHNIKEGANKRGNSSRLTQSFHFFMFEPIFSPVNAL
ncbi:hypothetical protein, partial [Aeromonas caviae]